MALAFRQRIFTWLVVISVVPAAIGITVALFAPRFAAPIGGARAWEQVAASWRQVRGGIDPERVSPGTRLAIEHHEEQLSVSVRHANQAEAIRSAFSGILAGGALVLGVLVFGGAVRLAGHLSRQLSRPIDELVAWTRHIQRGEPLPDAPPVRGAPEFAVLRGAFRQMASDLELARQREVEAAELRAFRDMARQVAHELKNPLTPIRFAVQRLAKDAPEGQRELIDVLDSESRRIEQMARDFGELGRLPEGPTAPVDMAELCQELAKGAPDGVVRVECAAGTPSVMGHYEPLRRALQNLVINAVHAVEAADGRRRETGGARGPGSGGGRGPEAGGGRVLLAVRPAPNGHQTSVVVTVQDDGIGIPAENLARVFEPHFTTKAGGTGLGLAIVRQTIRHHGGAIAVTSEPGRGSTFTVTLPGTST